MKSKTIGAALLAITCAFGLGACGSKPETPKAADRSSAPTATPAAAPNPGADTVKWLDQFCTAAGGMTDVAKKAPQFDESTPPAQMKAELGKHLDQLSTALGGMTDRFRALGKAPVPSLDEASRKLTTSFGQLKQVFDALKDRVGKADPADGAAFIKIGEDADTEVGKVNFDFDTKTDKSVEEAAAKAPACKKFTTS
ncbi:hypothetical protein [Amycolatopsis sp. NPDC059021]|uniref:hypothetical protein n=1 Tax=Amycolatopsis sp. NPDC059021 TaxID=3346704 RepID=UPI003672F4C8